MIKGEVAQIFGKTIPYTLIEELKIDIKELDKDGAIALGQGISNSHIKKLHINNAFVSFEASKIFFKNVKYSYLKDLFIGNLSNELCALESAKIIATSLKNLKLDAFRTSIGSFGVDRTKIIIANFYEKICILLIYLNPSILGFYLSSYRNYY